MGQLIFLYFSSIDEGRSQLSNEWSNKSKSASGASKPRKWIRQFLAKFSQFGQINAQLWDNYWPIMGQLFFSLFVIHKRRSQLSNEWSTKSQSAAGALKPRKSIRLFLAKFAQLGPINAQLWPNYAPIILFSIFFVHRRSYLLSNEWSTKYQSASGASKPRKSIRQFLAKFAQLGPINA